MEGWYVPFLAIGFFGIFFYVIFWIFEKFFGVRVSSRSGLSDSIRNIANDEVELNLLSNKNPQLIKQAIEACKNKGYSRTHTNILHEAHKIQNELDGVKSTSDKVFDKVKSLSSKIKTVNSTSKLEKLALLSELKNKGILNDEEFEKLKTEILK
jgi:hypothetical protein